MHGALEGVVLAFLRFQGFTTSLKPSELVSEGAIVEGTITQHLYVGTHRLYLLESMLLEKLSTF